MSHIFIFFGEDTFRLHEKITFWKKEFIKKYGDESNIVTFDNATSLREILSTASTLPFLTEKRLIFLENFLEKGKEEDQKKCAEALDKIPDYSILVFVEKNKIPDKRTVLFKKIQSIGKTETFEMMNENALVAWIQNYVHAKNGCISLKSADFLAKNVGNNLWNIQQEIEKLLQYDDSKKITEESIQLLTKAHIKTTIFKLTDYIGQKNTRLSFSTLTSLVENGEDIFYIFHMIIRQFRLLIQVKNLMEQKYNAFHITSELKQHPFVIKTIMAQTRNFNMERLKSIYKKLLEIEIGSKTGKIKSSTFDTREFSLAIERFILESCKK
ncbi:DNA polymerase III subunit delta [Candidatus Peregrinibacteria bacterium]|nr:DNA polymerase III subunit delta [Candidatus Peregrinibacteria bacterium]